VSEHVPFASGWFTVHQLGHLGSGAKHDEMVQPAARAAMTHQRKKPSGEMKVIKNLGRIAKTCSPSMTPIANDKFVFQNTFQIPI
jgi:hypothetical protein